VKKGGLEGGEKLRVQQDKDRVGEHILASGTSFLVPLKNLGTPRVKETESRRPRMDIKSSSTGRDTQESGVRNSDKSRMAQKKAGKMGRGDQGKSFVVQLRP